MPHGSIIWMFEVVQHSHDQRSHFSFESVYKMNIIRYVATSFETLNEKLTIFEMKFLINTFFFYQFLGSQIEYHRD